MTNSVAPVAPGRQQFFDANGVPLAGGTLAFYIPATLTPKDTWQDNAGTVLNTNPIVLDDLGSASIWGFGLYRQILKDMNGNLLWDMVTVANIAFPAFSSAPSNPLVGTCYFDTSLGYPLIFSSDSTWHGFLLS